MKSKNISHFDELLNESKVIKVIEEKTYAEVIKDTLKDALDADENVIILGEDIGRYGGAFGITRSFFEKYGSKRIIDMPMSEQAFIGFGIGAAMGGMRPIVEIMFNDFMTLAYDQLFNHASIFNEISCGLVKVPLTIRVPAGGGRGYGANHSKTLIAPFMHIPGIKIITPSRPSNARGLLNTALKSDVPVIFFEHKLLYYLKENVENAPAQIPLGKADIVKDGEDISIITFSKSVQDCLEVSRKFEDEGISIEVVDLRCLKPIDINTIKKTVSKTGKVLVVEEGYPTCGVASEIITLINEHCFYSLDATPRRIYTKEHAFPPNREMEQRILPSTSQIESEIRDMLDE